MQDKISVIIPVYNVAPYLNKCIASVRNQTYGNLEILLIDDGSTDGSGRICDEAAKEDTRIVVVHKKNGGLSDARNAGIEKAGGKYLMFVDSDDYIHEQMAECLYQKITDTAADIAMCEFAKIGEGGIPDEAGKMAVEADTSAAADGTAVFLQPQIMELLFEKRFLNKSTLVVVWNKLYRREIFKNLRFPEGMLHEDEYMIHHILAEAEKLVYVNRVLYYYIRHEDSIMGAYKENRIWDGLRAYEDRASFFLERQQPALYQKSMEEWLHYAKKSCRLCEEQALKDRRRIQKHLQGRMKEQLAQMKKHQVISKKRYIKERMWTNIPYCIIVRVGFGRKS